MRITRAADVETLLQREIFADDCLKSLSSPENKSRILIARSLFSSLTAETKWGKQEACEGCMSITRAAGVCSRTLCERRLCR